MAGLRGARLRGGAIEHQVIWNQWGGGIENILARSVTEKGFFSLRPGRREDETEAGGRKLMKPLDRDGAILLLPSLGRAGRLAVGQGPGD